MGVLSARLGDRPSAESVILIGVAAVFCVCALILAEVGVNILRPMSYVSNAVLYLSAWFLIEAPRYLRALFRNDPPSAFTYTAAYFRERWPAFRRGLPFVVAAVVFMPAFSAMKSAIPLFHDYTWDPALIAADRALFGTDAWRIVQPIFGYPIITSLSALAYHAWFLFIYAGVVYFAVYVPNKPLRSRFFLSFFAAWTVIGIIMAIGFASVGPCFVGPLLGMDTFAEQMAYLHRANQHFPVLVLDVQDQLLAWHRSGQHGLGRGITAMPSMHIALAVLFWLAMRQISRRAGVFFFLFLIVIWLSSVHLAYHYAVDGLASAAVVLLIWWGAGLLMRREDAKAL